MAKPFTVAMCLSNPYRPDPRVEKEALSLLNAGYKVTLICWDRLQEFPQFEERNHLEIIRLRVKSKYSAGSLQIFFLFIFLVRSFFLLFKIKPDLIHCHDLDTCFAGYLYSKWRSVPWIFDAHECYPEQISPQVNRPIYISLLFLERFFSVRANQVITVGNVLGDHFREFGAKVTIVGNYPLHIIDNYTKEEVSRRALSIPDDVLLVTYIGGFTLARVIIPLLTAAKDGSDFYILLAGDGPQRKEIDEIVKKNRAIIYLGWIHQELVPAYIKMSDIIYYGLKINDGNSQFSVPNTLFNTMAAGIPILTTDVGEIAKIVKEENCGIVIPAPTEEFIENGIYRLKNKAYRELLGVNGKKAFISKYNWGRAETELLALYTSIQNFPNK